MQADDPDLAATLTPIVAHRLNLTDRVLRAPRANLWRAWTEHFADWFVPRDRLAAAALDAAEEAGYRDLDLADIYAAGKSETVVGRWLAQDPQRRQRMQVQTKAGIRIPGGTAAGDAPMHYRLDAATVEPERAVA